MNIMRKLASWLKRWLASSASDPTEARIGTRFNTVLLLYIALLVAIVALSLGSPAVMQLFDREEDVGVWIVIFVFFILSAGVSFVLSKSGLVHGAVRFFVWSTFIGALLANALGGTQAMGYLFFFYFWAITIAGILLSLNSVLWMLVIGGVYFLLILVGEQQHLYRPLFRFPTRAIKIFVPVDGILTWLTVGGLLNFINIHRTQELLADLARQRESLSRLRREIEERVEKRTQALKERAARAQIIAELGRATTAILDLQQLLDETVSLISNRLGYYHVGIFLIDETQQWAVLEAASSEGGERMLRRGHRLQVGEEGIVGYVAKTGKSRIAADVGADATWFNNPDLPDTHSELALPLSVGNTILGVLDIQTEESQAFTEDDIEVLRALADSIAVAIDNAKHTKEMQDTLERLSRYREQDAILAWRAALSRRRAQINYTYSMGTVLSHSNAPVDNLPEASQVTVQTLPDGQQRLWLPLFVQGQRIGDMFFDRTTRWRDDEVQLAEYVMAQLEMALENARLLEETRLRAYQERARGEIVARVRASGTVNTILRSVAEGLGRALGVERSRVQLAQYED